MVKFNNKDDKCLLNIEDRRQTLICGGVNAFGGLAVGRLLRKPKMQAIKQKH